MTFKKKIVISLHLNSTETLAKRQDDRLCLPKTKS